jgi:subtilisin family serine protease
MDALDWAPAFGPGAPLDPLPRVVTNLSANEYGQDEDLEDKYLETWRDGMVHMISAGNIDQFEPVSGGIEYPAGIPGTLAITNLSWAGPPHQLHIIGQLGGSRYGPGVAFTAPGTAIFTTDRTGSDGACPVGGSSFCLMGTDDFAYLTGTSYAAPLTVAVAALVLSVRQDLPSGAVEWVLRETATDLGDPGWDQYFGWGLPQADAAVEFALRAIFFDDFELGDSSRWSAVIP